MLIEALKGNISRLIKQEVAPTTTDILFKETSPGFIKPSDYVLVVGPGIQIEIGEEIPAIPMDRSLIVLPLYMAITVDRCL